MTIPIEPTHPSAVGSDSPRISNPSSHGAEHQSLTETMGATKKTASTSFENIVKLRAQLSGNQLHQRQHSAQSQDAASVPIEKNFDRVSSLTRNSDGTMRENNAYSSNGNIYPMSSGDSGRNSSHASRMGALGSSNSSVDYHQRPTRLEQDSALIMKIGDYVFLNMCAMLQVPVPGRGVQYVGTLPVRALPPMCAATAVYAVQSASLLLKHALREDSSGQASRSVCAVLRCLLMLDDTAGRYCATLQAAQCVRIASMGRTQEIRYRARSESAIPDSVRKIIIATKEATLRVISCYRDVLLMVVSNYNSAASSAMFTKQQLLTIEAKLIELDASE